MANEVPPDQSYLLRLWATGSDRHPRWRASLERTDTGEQQSFATVHHLCAFLAEQIKSLPTDNEQLPANAEDHVHQRKDQQVAASGRTPVAEALQESEEHFRLLVESVQDYAIFMLDPDGHVGSWNAGAERILGYRADEIIGHHFARFFPPEALAQDKPAHELQVAARDGRCEDEGWRVRKDGSRFWANTVMTALRSAAGQLRGFARVTRDITERKQAEQALRQSRDQLAIILRGVADGIIAQDPRGRLIYANAAAARIIGAPSVPALLATSQEVLQRLEILDEAGRPLPLGRLPGHRALQGVPFPETLLRFRLRTTGAERWLIVKATPVRDEQGQVELAISIFSDITERVQAYQQLEQRVQDRTRELMTLLELSHTIASTLELQPLLALILDHLKCVVEYQSAAIFTIEGDDAVCIAQRGPAPKGQSLHHRFPYERLGEISDMLDRREPVLIADVQDETPLARSYQESLDALLQPTDTGVRSWMAVPLLVNDRMLGLSTLAHSEPNHYTTQQATLALAIADQAAVALERLHLFEQAQALAALEERQRLARDLHDAVTQTLFSASLIAEVLPRLWERNPDQGRRHLTELRHLTRGALAEMRTLLLELRPTALTQMSLGDLLGQLAETLRTRAQVPVALSVEGVCTLPADVHITLYRIAQEALNNVAKHARASQVAVELRCQPQAVELHISDNGRGFDPLHIPTGHVGTDVMRERAEAIGATLEIASQLGGGTQVIVRWTDPNREEGGR